MGCNTTPKNRGGWGKFYYKIFWKFDMIIIPSIDLLDGQAVRLKKGDYAQKTIYNPNPLELVGQYQNDGAKILHLVDLSGAKLEKPAHNALIGQMRPIFKGIIQVGGGIRTIDDGRALLNIGVDRLVIGSLAILNPHIMVDMIKIFGADKLVLALDFRAKDGKNWVAVKAWQEDSTMTIDDVITQFPTLTTILMTDISRDGMGQGTNRPFYQQFCQQYPHIAVQASGGVGDYADLLALANMGVAGAVVGKALYTGDITIKGAIECLKTA